MSLEGALLGLISSKGPVTGYDLSKMFRASMVHYWHARHGQIYPTLDKLKRRGFISCRKLIQRDRPNKKLYTITERGRGELVRWLRAPLKPLQMKHEALLKARFYAHLTPEEAVDQLAGEREQYEQLLEGYRALEREEHPHGVDVRKADELYAFLTLQRGILFLEESIRWCQWVQAEMERFNGKRGKRVAARK